MTSKRKIQGFEPFQRINYLYQISKQIAGKNRILSSYYANQMLTVARKNVLKIHPDIKRQVCKKCNSFLINNVTATVKIKGKKKNKSKVLESTCSICANKKRYPINEDYVLWVDKPEAVAEIIVT